MSANNITSCDMLVLLGFFKAFAHHSLYGFHCDGHKNVLKCTFNVLFKINEYIAAAFSMFCFPPL